MRGFTLPELLVSLFVFSIAIVAATQTFTSAYAGYRMTRVVQHDLENAQFAMNILAKTLRTSSVVSPATGPFPRQSSFIKFYDHSQEKCIHYRLSEEALEVASADASGGVSACDGMTLAAFTVVTTGTVTGSFYVTPSATVGGPATRVGRVTIALAISADANHTAQIQTSVSLRDFGNIGL